MLVVVPSATQAEAMAAYMSKTPFSQGDQPVTFSAQTACDHPSDKEPALARRAGDAAVVYLAAGNFIGQLASAIEPWKALDHRVFLFSEEVQKWQIVTTVSLCPRECSV